MMIAHKKLPTCLLPALVCAAWLTSLSWVAGQAASTTVDKLTGAFTITGFEVVNGVTEAVGVLDADDLVTNANVRLPVVMAGALASRITLLASLSSTSPPTASGVEEFIPPPELSTNLCTILAISIEFVDITIPGLGLNVHVNQLLLAIRADRETRLGDVLCTLLGEDAFLDAGTGGGVFSNTPTLSIARQDSRVALNVTGPGVLQSTTTLAEPIPWTDVLSLGRVTQTIFPTATMEFFRLAAAQTSKGGFSLGSVNGVFTVADMKSVNGSSLAAGWLTANVTDSMGVSEVGTFTNFPVRVPVSGVLSGGPVAAGIIDNPVILPQLSTNTCSLLGIVVGAIDVTIPGLGLNVHVNEISVVVRADRETTVGDLLCTLLGDDLLGAPLAATGTVSPASITEVSPNRSTLTLEQMRGLVGILLAPGLPIAPDVAGPQPASILAAKTNSSGKESKRAKLDLTHYLLQQVIRTVQPSLSLPKLKDKKDKNLKSAAR
jgi:hypothetical protein